MAPVTKSLLCILIDVWSLQMLISVLIFLPQEHTQGRNLNSDVIPVAGLIKRCERKP